MTKSKIVVRIFAILCIGVCIAICFLVGIDHKINVFYFPNQVHQSPVYLQSICGVVAIYFGIVAVLGNFFTWYKRKHDTDN